MLFSVTFGNLQGYSHTCLSECDFLYSCAAFDKISTERCAVPLRYLSLFVMYCSLRCVEHCLFMWMWRPLRRMNTYRTARNIEV